MNLVNTASFSPNFEQEKHPTRQFTVVFLIGLVPILFSTRSTFRATRATRNYHALEGEKGERPRPALGKGIIRMPETRLLSDSNR